MGALGRGWNAHPVQDWAGFEQSVLCIQKSCCDGKLDEGKPSNLENPPAAHKDRGSPLYQENPPLDLALPRWILMPSG